MRKIQIQNKKYKPAALCLNGGLLFIVQFCINNIFVIFLEINVLKLKKTTTNNHIPTRKCIDNTKNKHIHSSSVRGLNHYCSKHG